MKIYTVYLKPDGDKTLQSAVLVPEGFSWAAFVPGYHLLWAILKHNWILLFILVAYYLTGFPQSHLKGQWYLASVLIKPTLLFFIGVWGNDIWRFSLEKRGYHMAGIVSGRNESEAQLRFFEEISGTNYSNFHA